MSPDITITKLLGFPVNVSLVLQHLKQDMRDDWYFDTLQYEDLFSDASYICEIIEKAFSIGDGIYHSMLPTVRSIPKKNYAERYALETDFYDRFIYQAAISYLIPFIDTQLSNRVLSYRYEKFPLKQKYLFKNKIERWTTFEGLTSTYQIDDKWLAVTDLSNFFENISSEKVCDRITAFIPNIKCTSEEKVSIRAAVQCLRDNLKKWSFQSGIGLPQNRDASSFLSNVMLHDLDVKMVKLGHDYFRYVDDIRIICKSESNARKALGELARELRKYGFSLNGAKTRLLSSGSAIDEVAEVFTSKNKLISAINNMWRSRSRSVIMRSTKYICEIVDKCIKANDSQSRNFRFAVNRLSQLTRAGLVQFDDSLTTNIRKCLVESLYNHAVSTDQYCRILVTIDPDGTVCPEIEKYLCNRNACIHDWQNYNLWLFLARYKFVTEALKASALKHLAEAPESGEAAAILIWATATDSKDLIARQIDAYLSSSEGDAAWPFINQRYFLIAVNAITEEERKKLFKSQTYRLNYTTSRSKKAIPANGIPIIDPPSPEISFLIEEANDYV